MLTVFFKVFLIWFLAAKFLKSLNYGRVIQWFMENLKF
jgi:hypothetical protein